MASPTFNHWKGKLASDHTLEHDSEQYYGSQFYRTNLVKQEKESGEAANGYWQASDNIAISWLLTHILHPTFGPNLSILGFLSFSFPLKFHTSWRDSDFHFLPDIRRLIWLSELSLTSTDSLNLKLSLFSHHLQRQALFLWHKWEIEISGIYFHFPPDLSFEGV